MGKQYGLEYAEFHYYVPRGGTFVGSLDAAEMDRYVREHAVPL